MWLLQHVGHGAETEGLSEKSPSEIRFLCQTEYTVGRKDVDVLLRDDPSISRKHAKIFIEFKEEQINSLDTPTLSITDYSKFGTNVNGEALSGGTCVLSDGDEVKFGQMKNVYRAKYCPLVVASSSLSGSDKVKLKEYLLQLGGHQVNEWSKECVTLVMGKVGITVKAVCALASNKPIVTLEYLEALVNSVEKKTSLPDIDKFIPLLSEESDEYLLRPNPQREKVFGNKTFFFCNKAQFARMKPAIVLGGGTALLLERKPRSLSKITAGNAILMYCPETVQPEWYKECITHLTRHNKRYIQDAEIGHAMLYCSTEWHCNPQQSAGIKLHEHFSQKLTATQSLPSQAKSATQQAKRDLPAASVSASDSTIVPDSQHLNRPKPAERSAYISEMLPPPAVTHISETLQDSLSATQEKITLLKQTAPAKRTSTNQLQPPIKRMKTAVDERTTVAQSLETGSQNELAMVSKMVDTQTAESEDKSHVAQATAVDHSSFAPFVTDIATPERTSSILHKEVEKCHDDSVVEETQHSGTVSHTPAIHIVKSETLNTCTDRVISVKVEPTQPTLTAGDATEMSNERKLEIGDSWNRMQVDYGNLLRKTKLSVEVSVEERQGMALWKGKWVPNFKRFKKCGKKDITRLPTIIGGGDLVDGLCSQSQSHGDFVQMPSHVEDTYRGGSSLSHSLHPRTSIKSSIFGGHWELPQTKT